ncbi:MAG: STAS domain-containing protein, partial [Thermodesulfobacteriota bacterium]
MNNPAKIFSLPSLKALTEDNNTLRLKIKGPLNAYTTGKIWNDSLLALKSTKPKELIVDGTEIDYCDASGIALFVSLQLRQEKSGGSYKIEGLSEEINKLYNLFDPADFKPSEKNDYLYSDNKIEAAG